jgi:solute:Na+ symporter, SSS family
MAAAVLFAYLRPEPGSLLILAFDVVLAGCFVPLALGIYWKKSNTTAALASIICGGGLRLMLEPVFEGNYLGLATLIPACFSLVLFVCVALLTQKQSQPKVNAFKHTPTDQELISGVY